MALAYDPQINYLSIKDYNFRRIRLNYKISEAVLENIKTKAVEKERTTGEAWSRLHENFHLLVAQNIAGLEHKLQGSEGRNYLFQSELDFFFPQGAWLV